MTTVFLNPIHDITLTTRLLAPFFPRYRVLMELQKEPPLLRTALRNLVLTNDARFLFLRNHKAACTQITQILYSYSNEGAVFSGNVHRATRGITLGRYRWPRIKPVLAAGTAYTFTFVRHPERRALSAFRNFFLDQTNRARHKHMPGMRSMGFDPVRDDEWNFNAFLDYAALSLATDRANTDTHWGLQVDNIALGHIAYARIGRVENLDADLRAIFSEGGAADFPLEALLAKKHNASARTTVVTAAQRARIEQLYTADYEAFGY